MRFRTRVAIQAPVEVRDPAGGVTHGYETIDGLADVAATIMPAVEETRDSDLVTVRVAPTLCRRETVLVARQVAL
jgi:hypothetical protein